MGSKGHFYISLAKSVIRIVSCLLALLSSSVLPLAFGFSIAEGLGILEELVDKR